MKLTELAIRRPILFIVFYLVIAGFGIMSYSKLRYELLPELATPFITVTAEYPGGSPAEIENTVSKKLEDAVSGVSKVKKVSTTSAENASILSIEFTSDANVEKAMQDVQREINKIVSELPSGVKSPKIESFSVNMEPVLRVGATANIPQEQLYELLDKQIRPGISQLKNVGRVTLQGGAGREIKVLVDLNKLKSYHIGINEISEALSRSNIEIPIGTMKAGDGEFDVRTTGKASDLNDLRMQPVRTLEDGSAIYVKDLATVTEGKKEETVINRVNQVSSIGLIIDKQTGANAVEAARLVSKHLHELESQYGSIGLKFSIIQDSSEFTIEAANAVYVDFFIAVALVALVMLVFLHSFRNSLIVLLAIPTSLLTGFIMMYFMDYSLNLMTLLAMSLVIGILVDDSIVVLENIYRHMELGSDKRKASLDGRNEIGFAAMSITLVDVVVFLPLAFVPGLVGSLVKEFSLVIVVSTLSSLLVSFTLTPMISSRFAKLEHLDGKNWFSKFALFFERQIDKVASVYSVLLSWALVNKWKTIFISTAFLIASISLMMAGYVGEEFVPVTDKGEVALLITAPPGTRLDEMDRTVKAIENRVGKHPEVVKLFTLVGYQSDGISEKYNSNVASINISLVEKSKRNNTIAQLGRELRKIALEEPGVVVDVTTVGLFGANSAPIQLLLTGENRDSVYAAATRLLNDVKSIDGIVSPKLSVEETKPSFMVAIDRRKLADLGLTVEGISYSLRIAINGQDQMKFSSRGKDIDMRIVLRDESKTQIEDLENHPFINDKGQLIYLKQFAKVTLANAPSILERRNKNASVLLLAKVTGRASGDVGKDIVKLVSKKPLPSNISLSYEGDLDMQDDAFGNLAIALLVSLVLIYLIMVALYNNWAYPFVVLFSIPVGVGGAIIALALTAKSLNIFSIFGLIMMMGLVAKNAILLVDRANEQLAAGESLKDAIMDAGKTRLRPILMTTLAMVIGMLPLALANGAASVSSSLAWVLIGGLTSSMFLTLILVPVVHYGITRLMQKAADKKARRFRITQTTMLLLLLMMFSHSFAQSPAINENEKIRLTVDEAVARGLSQNRQIKTGELAKLKALYAKKEIEGNRYPQINATGTYLRNQVSSVVFFPSVGVNSNGELAFDDKKMMPLNATAKNQFSGVVDFRLPLFSKELQSAVRSAKLNEEHADASISVTKWELANEIRVACYNVMLAKLNQELAQKTVERAEITLKDSRILLKNGTALPSDTLNIYINVQNQVSAQYIAANQISQATDYLKDLINIGLENDLELTDKVDKEALQTKDLFINEPYIYTSRPDIRFNLSQQALAKEQIASSKSAKTPSLNLISQYQVQSQYNHFKFREYSWPNSFYVGVQLSVPIFNGFKNTYKIKQATIDLQELKNSEQELYKTAALDNSKALGNLKEALQRLQIQQNVIKAAEESLNLVSSRYRQGIGRYQDVLDGEFNLVQAKNGYNKSLYDALIARASVMKSQGGY